MLKPCSNISQEVSWNNTWIILEVRTSRLKLKHSWLVFMVYFTEFLNYLILSRQSKLPLPRFPRRVSKSCSLPYHLCKHTCINASILYAYPALNSGIVLYLFTVFSGPSSNTYVGYTSSCMLSPWLIHVWFPQSQWKSRSHWSTFPCGSATIAGTDPMAWDPIVSSRFRRSKSPWI